MFSKISRLIEFLVFALALAAAVTQSRAQLPPHPAQSAIDSDQDGLSDDLEQALLVQFAPRFQIGHGDCSNVPAEFRTAIHVPEVLSENGTIYGQVFPVTGSIDGAAVAEIHYYHLWRLDCGGHGHPLDTEHVSVLVRASNPDLPSATWKALYWYAAAHENTVCDVSQVTHASTLHAEDAGARIWISPGKHASYLEEALCQRGCGADRCEHMISLSSGRLINLGEPGHPMNGSAFIASAAWPLAAKMAGTNFPAATLARLSTLPDSEIAWFKAGRHPSQGIIAISSTTEQALANSGRNTMDGISSAAEATDSAVTTAKDSSGNALQKSYRHTMHALGTSMRHVGKSLQLQKLPDDPKQNTEGKPQ